ncbi:MAG: F0F1 ATP synthase subunit epsilon [Alphaproteobacteria bacterium]|nr:F0F1 ATP synthase subunit epsilon [Alphaproteobacteria bacterium]
MSENVEFELVSPERLLVSESVEMVVIPGAEGDFGVLAGHAATVSSIRPGVLAVFENGNVASRVFIAGGFAEITPERCTVLADSAIALEDLNRAEIDKSIADLRDDVNNAHDDDEKEAAEKALVIAEAKIAALDSPIY